MILSIKSSFELLAGDFPAEMAGRYVYFYEIEM
jgi:hypothetical protein